jgi:hypothetical protein
MVEQTTGDAADIRVAAQQISHSSRDMTRSVDLVAAVTEENTAPTEQMAAGSAQVMDSVSRIATKWPGSRSRPTIAKTSGGVGEISLPRRFVPWKELVHFLAKSSYS